MKYEVVYIANANVYTKLIYGKCYEPEYHNSEYLFYKIGSKYYRKEMFITKNEFRKIKMKPLLNENN